MMMLRARLWVVLVVAAVLAACSLVPVQPAPPPATVVAPPPTRTPQPAATALPSPRAEPATTPTRAPQPSAGGRGAPQALEPSGPVDLYAAAAAEFPPDLEWLNVARPLTLAGLRGKMVLLDFWTYGCINCVHNFPDLQRLQEEYPDELVVIGVHSAKFTTEADTENIRQTLLRYHITYPVVNDNHKLFWELYGATAWPTTVLIDTSGVLAGIHTGEGAYPVFKPLLVSLLHEAEARGRLDRTPLNLALESAGRPDTVLSFPGKVLAESSGKRLFISDSGHNRVVAVDAANGMVQGVFGSGAPGFADGDARTAAFRNPQGLALSADGAMLYVADSGNHAVRAIELASGQVQTIAGTGQRSLAYPPLAGPPLETALSSPWDLALRGSQLFIAMAGSHQIWRFDLAADQIVPLAGSGREGVLDGPAPEANLAQPGGLAYDGASTLFIADTESSAVRFVRLDGKPEVGTLAGGGTNLFAFGDSDGVGREARFQHPQGIAFANGMLFVVDTYNNKIRRVDAASGDVQTLAGAERGWRDGAAPLFNEPSGISAAGTTLYVADTNNHVIRTLDMATGRADTLVLQGIEQFAAPADQAGTRVVTMPPAQLQAGSGIVRLDITLPQGYKVNDLAPSSVRWTQNGTEITLP
ncbi:MAG TPA: thioredoxin-like domain-containing protein, partial [Roseiflexaceae bacterium]|nr:thioredoxin-like domain-containing protein [Roseiflexaceae bacterium]